MHIFRIVLPILFLFIGVYIYAQPAYYFEIRAFKKQDSAHFPGLHKILFVGSSSFNYWKDVQSYFPQYPIINRGFGGSTLLDVIAYAKDIIIPYKPKQVIIYCGENDLAYSNKTTPKMVLDRLKKLISIIRKDLPDVPIAYVSIKPSPQRDSLISRMRETNKLIKDFISKEYNAIYIDVFNKMLDKDGKPKAEIFNPDHLHMNAKGYEIWKAAIEPALIKS